MFKFIYYEKNQLIYMYMMQNHVYYVITDKSLLFKSRNVKNHEPDYQPAINNILKKVHSRKKGILSELFNFHHYIIIIVTYVA